MPNRAFRREGYPLSSPARRPSRAAVLRPGKRIAHGRPVIPHLLPPLRSPSCFIRSKACPRTAGPAADSPLCPWARRPHHMPDGWAEDGQSPIPGKPRGLVVPRQMLLRASTESPLALPENPIVRPPGQGPWWSDRDRQSPFPRAFAQVSRRPTVRLKTGLPGWLSASTQK